MTSREQVKDLKGQLKYTEDLNKFLLKKVEQQSQELLKVAKTKGQMSTLRKQIAFLQEDNNRLASIIAEYEAQSGDIIDFQRKRLQKQINELKVRIDDLRIDIFHKVDKVARLEYELKQTKALLVNLPSYGEIPKEVYDYIKSLESQLKIAQMNCTYLRDRRDIIRLYCTDAEQGKRVESYLDNYERKKRGARQKISPEKIDTIRRLRKGGMSIRDIAAFVEVSVGSVHRFTKEIGE